jgi:hypothetical protein
VDLAACNILVSQDPTNLKDNYNSHGIQIMPTFYINLKKKVNKHYLGLPLSERINSLTFQTNLQSETKKLVAPINTSI